LCTSLSPFLSIYFFFEEEEEALCRLRVIASALVDDDPGSTGVDY
jgi:hypothetical protein